MFKVRMVDWKLKYKVIFHIIVIGIISGSLLLLIFLNSVRKVVETLNSRKMVLVGAIINDHIEHALSMQISPDLNSSLADIAATEAVDRVRILDTEGKVLHSSATEETGTSVPAPDRLWLKTNLRDQAKAGSAGVKMRSMDRSYLPIENKPECWRCHGAEKRLIGILDVKFNMSGEAAVLGATRRLGLGVAVLTLILMTFVTYRLYARIIEKPLTLLMNHMRRVEEGDRSPRLKVTRIDEFGTLAQSFNAMTDRLEEASLQAARHHDLQMEKAGHLASLGELAAGLAHEIKNPIAGIKGAAEIVIQQTPTDDPRREVFEEIRQQADRIHVIIQNLLHFSRPRELTIKPENPNAFVWAALRMAEHQTEGKNIRFRFVPLEDAVTAELDGDKLQEVILNLLLNGIAAIDKEGEILITMKETDGKIMIQVEDTGKGIAPEHLPLIFNPFFTTRKKGTGLGLSLCRQIVQAHGGTITAESELGRRTIFTIYLPAKKAGVIP